MPRHKLPLSLSSLQREQLERWSGAPGTPQGVALRCRIVLAAAGAKTDLQIAGELRVSRPTVVLWRKRFAEQVWWTVTDHSANRARAK